MEKTSTKGKLLMAARKLLLAYGIKKVNVEDICKEAGCSKNEFFIGCIKTRKRLLKQYYWK